MAKVEHLNVLEFHIHASYAIHHNMKWNTGASLFVGFFTLIVKSIKQKLYLKSITEY